MREDNPEMPGKLIKLPRDAMYLVGQGLYAAGFAVQSLGDSGHNICGEQRDVTTKADIAAGERIIDYLRTKKVPLVVYSEEHPRTQTAQAPTHSVVFDEIDGTLNYKEGMGMLPHGPIFGVFEGIDPRFEDCLASGFRELNSGQSFYARKGRGTIITTAEHETRRTETSGRKSMKGDTPMRLVPDIYSLGDLAHYFVKLSDSAWIGDFRSTAAHMALLAAGYIDVFITGDNCHIPAKHKTGEELGPGYLLVKEAGGVVVDWEGNDVGPERIALDEKRTFNAVCAATPELAEEFIDWMHNYGDIRNHIVKTRR